MEGTARASAHVGRLDGGHSITQVTTSGTPITDLSYLLYKGCFLGQISLFDSSSRDRVYVTCMVV
jgi:hypothetical protein